MTVLSGVTPCMSKSCETIREPAFILSNWGISRTFRRGKKIERDDVGPAQVELENVLLFNSTSFSTSLVLAFSWHSLIRCGSMS